MSGNVMIGLFHNIPFKTNNLNHLFGIGAFFHMWLQSSYVTPLLQFYLWFQINNMKIWFNFFFKCTNLIHFILQSFCKLVLFLEEAYLHKHSKKFVLVSLLNERYMIAFIKVKVKKRTQKLSQFELQLKTINPSHVLGEKCTVSYTFNSSIENYGRTN